MKMKETLDKMTLKERISLGSGADFWHTKSFNKYNIEGIMVADGPHGLRKQEDTADHLGINESVAATCFPTAVSSACSFDEELLGEIGEAIAKEALANKVGVVLGPGANIKRNPLCGRNFEYFSEDPYLSGKLAASFIRSVEKLKVGTSLKHFAANNQEYKRFSSDSVVDERTLREIYLTGFEIAVKEGKPSTVMSSYNRINGVYSCNNKRLLTDILRDEWGFDGAVVTDWGGMDNRILGYKAGCDLVMPGGSAFMEKECYEAVNNGELSEADVNNSAERVLRLIQEKSEILKSDIRVDMDTHHKLALKVAEESAVLLKNDGILPLTSLKDVCFIGSMAKHPRYQGSGSSHINPYKLVSALDVCGEVAYSEGVDENGNITPRLLSEAVSLAKESKTVVLFLGLPNKYESEGFDREHMRLPDGHNELVEAIKTVNSNIVVVLSTGSVVELPWINEVKALLYMGLPGQAGGEAIRNLLLGNAVPSGKLAESWPIKYEDCICSSFYSQDRKDAHYREAVYVGYRYYSSANVPVQFPFGYGLSYSSFSYSDLVVDGNKVSFTITNTGEYAAKEIAQLYVSPVNSSVFRPIRELKGFKKVKLNPNESKKVTLELNDRSFAIWDDGWKILKGEYNILIGSSSDDIYLSTAVKKGDQIIKIDSPKWYTSLEGVVSNDDFENLIGYKINIKPLRKGEFTMNNTVMEMKDYSLIMKIMFKAVEIVVSKGFGWKKDYNNPDFKMMISAAADGPLSSMKISGGLNNYILEGMLEIANGHFFKGIRLMMKKD